jgi:hypothetical protein
MANQDSSASDRVVSNHAETDSSDARANHLSQSLDCDQFAGNQMALFGMVVVSILRNTETGLSHSIVEQQI